MYMPTGYLLKEFGGSGKHVRSPYGPVWQRTITDRGHPIYYGFIPISLTPISPTKFYHFAYSPFRLIPISPRPFRLLTISPTHHFTISPIHHFAYCLILCLHFTFLGNCQLFQEIQSAFKGIVEISNFWRDILFLP
jgi:hypothetical protein